MTKIAIIFCNTLLLLATVECGALFAEWVHPERPDMEFAYSPYRMLRMSNAPFPLNSEGFRAKELDLYRNKFLVEFLGGSVCVGVGTNPGPIIPERLEQALHRAGMKDAAVLNLCQGGATSAQELAVFLQYGLPLSPQVVLSFDGANDLLHPAPFGDDMAANLPYRNREIQSLFEGHHAWFQYSALFRVTTRLARRFPPPAAVSVVPAERILNAYVYSLEVVRTLTRSQGGYYAVLLQPTLHHRKPWSSEEIEMWRERRPADGARMTKYVSELYSKAGTALEEWSAETGAPVLDLTRTFSHTPETVYSDSVHFTGERGYQLLYQELVRQGLVAQIAERYRMWEEQRRLSSQRSSLWRQ